MLALRPGVGWHNYPKAQWMMKYIPNAWFTMTRLPNAWGLMACLPSKYAYLSSCIVWDCMLKFIYIWCRLSCVTYVWCRIACLFNAWGKLACIPYVWCRMACLNWCMVYGGMPSLLHLVLGWYAYPKAWIKHSMGVEDWWPQWVLHYSPHSTIQCEMFLGREGWWWLATAGLVSHTPRGWYCLYRHKGWCNNHIVIL